MSSMIPEDSVMITEDDIIKIAYSFFTIGVCMKIQVDKAHFEQILGDNKDEKS